MLFQTRSTFDNFHSKLVLATHTKAFTFEMVAQLAVNWKWRQPGPLWHNGFEEPNTALEVTANASIPQRGYSIDSRS